MKLIVLFCSLIAFSCLGCKDTIKPSDKKTNTAVLDSLSKQKINLTLLQLSPTAAKDLEDFDDLQSLKKMMKIMRNANPYTIHKHADSVATIIMNVNDNLTEELKVNSIFSRITVLNTASGLLVQQTEQQYPNSNQLLEKNTMLIEGYNSLIIQLNELSLAIPDRIEKELLRTNDTIHEVN